MAACDSGGGSQAENSHVTETLRVLQASLQSAFALLGLPPDAPTADVQRAFRRLVKRHHPDVARHPGSARSLARIVEAYRTICAARPTEPAVVTRGPCPCCGRAAELFGLLDGRRACVDCLFGGMWRRRVLPGPAPLATVARYGAVLLLYGVAAVLLGHYFRNAAPLDAALGLTCLWSGFALLVLRVLRIVRTVGPSRRGGQERLTSTNAARP